MAFIHGKGVSLTVDGDDLSAYTNSCEVKLAADSHDVTCMGKTAHDYRSGLTDGTVTLKGVYDDSATGPQLTFQPALGAGLVTCVYKPEGGTGAGKPIWTFSVTVTAYEESAPVAEMITWTAEMQMASAITITAMP